MRTYRVVRSMWSEKYNIYEFTYRVTQKDGGIEELVHRSSMCYLFREDIIDRVEESGLKVHEMFGDFDSSALTDQSPELIIVAGT